MVSPVNPDIRSQTTYLRTRYEGARGIAQHVRKRPGRNARLTVRLDRISERLF